MANMIEFVAGSPKVGPLIVADRLEEYGRRTLQAIAEARGHVERGGKEFACTDADMMAHGNLGIYYAEKLRGAAHLARWMFGAPRQEQQEAMAHLELALKAWREVVAATENHYIPHEVWLFGQFDWNRYLPDVEADIRIARETKPFRSGQTYAEEGLHDWLVFANGLLKRGGPIRVEAASAQSITAPLALASGYIEVKGSAAAPRESITGAREFVSPEASATWRVEVPSDGAYRLRARCWWPERAGGITVLVDEDNMRSRTVRPGNAALQTWHEQSLATALELGGGSHTIRIVSRTPGARLEWLELVPAN